MTAKHTIGTLAVALVLLSAGRAESAATFVINNLDPAGVGFNDPTVVAPVGGNPGTTVGQQRLNAFTYAANLWGSVLTSTQTINVNANFGPLTCTATTGTLGSAGPVSVVFFGVAVGVVPANTLITTAEAEKLGSANYNGAAAEISASFNGNIGTVGCLPASSWYYGFDQNPGLGQIDFVTVLLHELAHGLGFLTFVDVSTGAEADIGYGGQDDIFEVNLRDNTSGTGWTGMSNAQRQASAINTNNVVWTGTNVTTGATATTGQDGSSRKMLYTPNPVQVGSSVSHWTQTTTGSQGCPTCTDLTPIDLMKPAYTVPVHNTFITHLAMQDIGWGPVASVPVEISRFVIE